MPVTSPNLGLALVRLARPHQWAKSAFVLVGPAYAAADGRAVNWGAVGGAVLAMGLASSTCYVVNDIRDRESDRAHPRKRLRPVASGAVAVRTAWVFAGALLLATAGALAIPILAGAGWTAAGWLAVAVGVYLAMTTAYSLGLKDVAVADVIALSSGFVLRVLGGCAAGGVTPSTWLLNCTFFVSMFLSLGKRLGERRTMGGDAAAVRGVHAMYTDDVLRMAVVVTAVASLITYAGYVQQREAQYTHGFNLLWLTMIPATFGLLRCIVLTERGRYDDPTELATHDRPFQLALGVFALITALLVGFARSRP